MPQFAESPFLYLLKSPVHLIVMAGFSALFFDIQFFIMSRLPGSYEGEMCLVGGGLVLSNVLFALLISMMASLFLVSFYYTLKAKKSSMGTLSFTSFGALLGALTIFCPACTFLGISLFGVSIGVTFLTTYGVWFKAVSLLLMFLGLYQVNKQLKGECKSCVN